MAIKVKKRNWKKKSTIKRVWHFIWEENSVLSWVVNIIIAFVLVKFIIYPGLGLALDTTHPVVAVMSSSMEHRGNFGQWWGSHNKFYSEFGINREEFLQYKFSDGFNKGDLMILVGTEKINVGDVIVFRGEARDPIIHRVVNIKNGNYQTKGDGNFGSRSDEIDIRKEMIIGKAVFRIPYLGWFKLGFIRVISFFGLYSRN